MYLILDFGNTYQKCAIFDDDDMIYFAKFENISLIDIKGIVESNSKIRSCILSSVMDTPKDIILYLKSKYSFIELGEDTQLPLINKYSTPNTLGKDRLAAAIAVNKLAKDNNALSIDIGTAIKFDIVNNKNEYIGGSISPGLFLRFKSLHTFTAKLPLVNYNNIHELIGNDTETSILSGVMNGAIAEVNTFIDKYKNEFEDVKIFITGGESIYFENHIKSDIFVISNLVLLGLNEILKFNEAKF